MSVRKEGRRWQVVLELGRDPATGKRKQRVIRRDPLTGLPFTTKKRAQEVEAEQRVALYRGEYVPPEEATVAQLMDMWLAATAPHHAASTHYNAASCIRARILPALGARRVRDVQPGHLARFYAEQAERYAPNSVANTRNILTSAFAHAVRWRIIARNPHEGLRLPRGERTERVVWTAEQTRIFLEIHAQHEDVALWRLLADSGMRIGEALALTWDDYDAAARVVRVEKTVAITAMGSHDVAGRTKSAAGRRTISLSAETCEALRVHRLRQAERKLALGPVWRDRKTIFTNETGGLLSASTVRKRLDRAVAACGLPRITPHALRHMMATTAVAAGVPLHAVQKRLGHANFAMTSDLYSHMDQDADRAVSEAVAKALG